MAQLSEPADASSPRGIDPRVPRFAQAMTGTFLLVLFVLAAVWPQAHWGVVVVTLLLAAGAVFGPRHNPWGLLFRHVLTPMFRIGPPAARKDGAPARFAMSLGTVFLVAASVLLIATTGAAYWTGWALALAVAALALLAAVTNLCVGCEIYNALLRSRTRAAQKRQ